MIPDPVKELLGQTDSRLPQSTFGKRSFETWVWPGEPREGGLVPEESIPLWQSLGRWRNQIPPFYYLYGPPGIGKTHIALAIGWDTLVGYPGARVLFYQVESLMDTIRAGFDSGNSNQLIEATKSCALLILDDIGAQKLTEWSLAKLDSIIDTRYIENRETIFTSNYSLNDAERIPPRIADRIREGVVARVRGESRRGAHGKG